MTSKENCPNGLVFSSFAWGTVCSHKKEIDHMSKWFDEQLINNLCPACPSDAICTHKTELLDNLKLANERREIFNKYFEKNKLEF